MILHNSKQLVFLESVHWTRRRRFWQLWRISFAKNVKYFPQNRKKNIKVFGNKVFIPTIYQLDKLTSVLTNPRKKFGKFRKCFVQLISRSSTFLQIFLQKLSGRVQFTIVKLEKKELSEVEVLCSNIKISWKELFLRESISQNRFSGPVEWSAVLTILLDFFWQKYGKFSIQVVKQK